ncbi:MAG TPA: DinB family protein [Bacteroidia bacterium]|jgi:hypothetical protein|nr:DinB family protein [Bacteroidia bacterium]
MTITSQLAKHFKEVHYGGNWTGSNLKDILEGITWKQAVTVPHNLTNSIAVLVFHMNYYIDAVIKVLEGGPLDAHDKFSFNCPPVQSQQDWDQLLNKYWADANKFIALVEALPESKLSENMLDGKYGNYYRNLAGIIEHCHYHLGQVALVKKLSRA